MTEQIVTYNQIKYYCTVKSAGISDQLIQIIECRRFKKNNDKNVPQSFGGNLIVLILLLLAFD